MLWNPRPALCNRLSNHGVAERFVHDTGSGELPRRGTDQDRILRQHWSNTTGHIQQDDEAGGRDVRVENRQRSTAGERVDLSRGEEIRVARRTLWAGRAIAHETSGVDVGVSDPTMRTVASRCFCCTDDRSAWRTRISL